MCRKGSGKLRLVWRWATDRHKWCLLGQTASDLLVSVENRTRQLIFYSADSRRAVNSTEVTFNFSERRRGQFPGNQHRIASLEERSNFMISGNADKKLNCVLSYGYLTGNSVWVPETHDKVSFRYGLVTTIRKLSKRSIIHCVNL